MQLSHEERSASPLLNQEQELCTLGEVSSNPQLPLSPNPVTLIHYSTPNNMNRQATQNVCYK